MAEKTIVQAFNWSEGRGMAFPIAAPAEKDNTQTVEHDESRPMRHGFIASGLVFGHRSTFRE